MNTEGLHEGYDDTDGLATVEKLARLRFGRDQRLQEVGRMLCSSVPVRMEIGTGMGHSNTAAFCVLKHFLLAVLPSTLCVAPSVAAHVGGFR
jgi:hypothetical protein